MPRSTNAPASRKRRKRILKKAKGFIGSRSKLFRTAKDSIYKAQQWAYRDRKNRKRTFRALWIQRINAAVRNQNLTYSQFMNGLKLSKIELDRKVLSDMAINDSESFSKLVDKVLDTLKSNKKEVKGN